MKLLFGLITFRIGMQDIWKKYKSKFKEVKLLRFLPNKIKVLSINAIYKAYLMYYAYKREETPTWAKHIVIGTLGYLLSPIDMLPDLTPVIGYTDDFSVLAYGLVMVSCYINKEVHGKALQSTKKLYGNFDESMLHDTPESVE